jgi:hypothetical protein
MIEIKINGDMATFEADKGDLNPRKIGHLLSRTYITAIYSIIGPEKGPGAAAGAVMGIIDGIHHALTDNDSDYVKISTSARSPSDQARSPSDQTRSPSAEFDELMKLIERRR